MFLHDWGLIYWGFTLEFYSHKKRILSIYFKPEAFISNEMLMCNVLQFKVCYIPTDIYFYNINTDYYFCFITCYNVKSECTYDYSLFSRSQHSKLIDCHKKTTLLLMEGYQIRKWYILHIISFASLIYI